jgi:hypothetical protein
MQKKSRKVVDTAWYIVVHILVNILDSTEYPRNLGEEEHIKVLFSAANRMRILALL